MGSKIEFLIDKKLLTLVRLFLHNDNKLYSLYLISQESKVPLGSTFRLISKLVDCGLVEVIHVGKTKLYKTNIAAAKEFRILQDENK